MAELVSESGGRIRLARTGRVARVVWGLANLAMAAIVGGAVYGLIDDRIARGTFNPTQDFMFFTIQVSILCTGVFLWGGWSGLFRRMDSRVYSVVRASLVPWAVTIAAVYNVLLRQVPAEGTLWEMLQRPNELVHVWIPAFIVVEWLLQPGRARLGFGVMALSVSYPWMYITVCLIRGQVDGWYPYPFLAPDPVNGWLGPIEFMASATLFIVIVTFATVFISRVIRHILPLHRTVEEVAPSTKVIPVVVLHD